MSRPPSSLPYAAAVARVRDIDTELTSLYARSRQLLTERAAVISRAEPPPRTEPPTGRGGAVTGTPPAASGAGAPDGGGQVGAPRAGAPGAGAGGWDPWVVPGARGPRGVGRAG